MRITDVRTAVVEANFDWTYVRIYTDGGLYGTGECFLAPGLTGVIADLRPLLVGEDPRDIDRLVKKMLWGAMSGGMSGLIWNAISGIEAALWDVIGKSLKAPVWQLLGGRYRDRIRIYADCHAGESLESMNAVHVTRKKPWIKTAHEEAPPTPESYGKSAQKAVHKGFTMIKFDCDIPGTSFLEPHNYRLRPEDYEFLRAAAHSIRHAVGNDVEFAMDCHWRFSVADAQQLAAVLADSKPSWLEDPVPPGNVAAMKAVTEHSPIPILTGEHLNALQGFQELLVNHAIHYAAPDPQKAGGLLETKRIADLAHVNGINVVPHNIASPIGTMASVHCAATMVNFVALEYHAMDVPFWNDLVLDHDGPLIRQGHIAVPEKPGIGVELNEEVARKYAKEGEPWFNETD